ncbi:MAG: hypothetical protein V1777_05790 [Candidatus Micrarchaeota archaeon]
MVFGIGEGKIDIKLAKFQFASGETIAGTVTLQVNNPKKARGVRIEFFGEQITGYGKNRRLSRVYEFSLNLDGEKEYFGYKEYPFQITIPQNLFAPKTDTEGVMGTVLQAAQMLGAWPQPVQWYLAASLDLAVSFDISKKIQLNIV